MANKPQKKNISKNWQLPGGEHAQGGDYQYSIDEIIAEFHTDTAHAAADEKTEREIKTALEEERQLSFDELETAVSKVDVIIHDQNANDTLAELRRITSEIMHTPEGVKRTSQAKPASKPKQASGKEAVLSEVSVMHSRAIRIDDSAVSTPAHASKTEAHAKPASRKAKSRRAETVKEDDEDTISLGGDTIERPEGLRASVTDNTYDRFTRKLSQKGYFDFEKSRFSSAQEGAQHSTKRARSFLMRAFSTLPLAIASTYLTFAPQFQWPVPFGLSMHTPFIYILLLFGAQVVSMMISCDVMASGLHRLLTGRSNSDTLVVASALASMLHMVTIILRPDFGGYLPYAAISCASIFLTLLAKFQKYSALRRSYKAASFSSEPKTVRSVQNTDKRLRAFRGNSDRDLDVFSHIEDDGAEHYLRYFAPIAIVLAIVLAVLSSFSNDRGFLFFWAFAAISSVLAPFGLIFSYASPFSRVVKRIFASGSTIAGYKAAQSFFKVKEVVLYDLDLFPADALSINGVKILSHFDFDRVLTYTASIIKAANLPQERVFLDFIRSRFIQFEPVSELKHYESGGILAYVRGDAVLIGTPAFLIRMGVRVREGLDVRTGIFVAINSTLAGIFAMNYKPSPQTAHAFSLLRRSRLSIILATNDFNITPAMLMQKYKLKRDIFEYPDIIDRLAMSDSSYYYDEPPHALLAREGVEPYCESIIFGAQLFKTARTNMRFGIISSVLGMLLMFYLAFTMAFVSATPYNVFMYLLLWCVPTVLSTARAGKI